jgi:hypothetical protein
MLIKGEDFEHQNLHLHTLQTIWGKFKILYYVWWKR